MSSNSENGRLSERHARRQPAHLSVSLRHDTPSTTTWTSSSNLKSQPLPIPGAKIRNASVDTSSDENEAPNANKAQTWFDRANFNPSSTFSQTLQGEYPPGMIREI